MHGFGMPFILCTMAASGMVVGNGITYGAGLVDNVIGLRYCNNKVIRRFQ